MATKKKTSTIAKQLLGSERSDSRGREQDQSGSTVSTIARPITTVNAPSYNTVATTNPSVALDPFSAQGIQAAADAAPQYNPVQSNVPKWNPTKTPAQRAQDIVNAQYGRKTAAINSQMGSLDQDLAVGQATQDKYAVYGDAKLKTIYDELGVANQGIADQIKTVYGDASKAVGASYDTADATLAGVNQKAQASLAASADQLGIGQALPGSSASLDTYIGQQQSTSAKDRANSQSNIDTLGANMSAAALKDVASIKTYGADNRRDLVMQVQNTKAQLQYDHDKSKKQLLDDLAALESEKADAMSAATSEQESLDYERQYNEEKDRINTEFQNRQLDLQTRSQNLQNEIAKLNAQDSHEQQVNSNRLAEGAQDIQKAQLQDALTNSAFNRQIAAKQMGISEAELDLKIKQFGFDQSQAIFSNALSQKSLDLNWAQLDAQQKQQALENIRADKSLSLDERKVTAAEMDQISMARARADQSVVDKQAAATAAAKVAAAADPNSLDNQIKRANLARIEAITQATNSKVEAQSRSTEKYGSLKEYNTANKTGPIFQSTVNTILARSTKLATTLQTDPKTIAYSIIYNQKFPDSDSVPITPEEDKLIGRIGEKNLEQDRILQAVVIALTKG